MAKEFLLEPFDYEIERTFQVKRSKQKLKRTKEMAQQNKEKTAAMQIALAPRLVRNYWKLKFSGIPNIVFRHLINAHNFELKLAIISMVQNSCQFGDMPHEDRNAHIAVIFIWWCY